MDRSIEQIAVELLRCAVTHDPASRLIGNVTAREVATVVIDHITSCPKCGAEPWCNIDCDLCTACAAMRRDQ